MTNKVLENAADVARRRKVNPQAAAKALKAHAKPAYEFASGRGTMRLYAPDEADRVIDTYLEAVRQQRQEAKSGTTQEAAPAAVNLTPIHDALEELQAAVKKVQEQNAVLLRSLTSRLDVMQEAIVELATRPTPTPTAAAPAPEPGATPAPPVAPEERRTPAPTSPPRRPPVRIVGLHDNKTEHIRREYGAALDLSFVNPDKSTKAAQSSPSAAVTTIVMADFVGHSVCDTLTANGVRYKVVHGGLTALRTALSELTEKETESL